MHNVVYNILQMCYSFVMETSVRFVAYMPHMLHKKLKAELALEGETLSSWLRKSAISYINAEPSDGVGVDFGGLPKPSIEYKDDRVENFKKLKKDIEKEEKVPEWAQCRMCSWPGCKAEARYEVSYQNPENFENEKKDFCVSHSKRIELECEVYGKEDI